MIPYGDGPSAEIRCILISFRNQNQCVAAVKPSASNCPPESCIESFESLIRKMKTERAYTLSVFMVRVPRFELGAS